MHAQMDRRGLPLTLGRVWATPLRPRSGEVTDHPRAHELHTIMHQCRPVSTRASIEYQPTTCRLLRAADEPQNALDDTYLRLYDTDGETVLDENDDELVGKESLIHWICQKTGCDGLVTITVSSS